MGRGQPHEREQEWTKSLEESNVRMQVERPREAETCTGKKQRDKEKSKSGEREVKETI